MKYCIDCGKKVENAKRCQNCYIIYLKEKAKKNTIVCAQCQQECKHYGFGLCKKCYQREYMQDPERKKIHAEKERLARAAGERKETEERRNRSQRRKNWKRKYHQKYYVANKDVLLAYQREYRKQKERMALYAKRRKLREKQTESTLTPEQWNELLELHNHSCAYCGANDVPLEEDHRVPVSRGGGRTFENIVPSCSTCNRRKKDKTDKEYAEYIYQLQLDAME